jgi:hypothetical protein
MSETNGATVTAAPLVERLQEAAGHAIANERQGLEYEPERLRSVVIELELSNAGAVISDARCYVERQARVTRGSR